MNNDFMREFCKHANAKDMMSALKEKFRKTSLAHLKALAIKFDTYKKCPDYNMHKHLRHMSNIINELKDVGHELTFEQCPSCYLFPTLKLGIYENDLTHNVHIQTMEDVI